MYQCSFIDLKARASVETCEINPVHVFHVEDSISSMVTLEYSSLLDTASDQHVCNIQPVSFFMYSYSTSTTREWWNRIECYGLA